MSTGPLPEYTEIGNKQYIGVGRGLIYSPIVSRLNTCPVDINVHPTETP